MVNNQQVILQVGVPPLIAVVVVGMLVASIPCRIFLYAAVDLVDSYHIDNEPPVIPPPIALNWEFASYHLLS